MANRFIRIHKHIVLHFDLNSSKQSECKNTHFFCLYISFGLVVVVVVILIVAICYFWNGTQKGVQHEHLSTIRLWCVHSTRCNHVRSIYSFSLLFVALYWLLIAAFSMADETLAITGWLPIFFCFLSLSRSRTNALFQFIQKHFANYFFLFFDSDRTNQHKNWRRWNSSETNNTEQKM